jgi:hypothetical protein
VLFGGWPRTVGKMAKTTVDGNDGVGWRGGANWKHAQLPPDVGVVLTS